MAFHWTLKYYIYIYIYIYSVIPQSMRTWSATFPRKLFNLFYCFMRPYDRTDENIVDQKLKKNNRTISALSAYVTLFFKKRNVYIYQDIKILVSSVFLKFLKLYSSKLISGFSLFAFLLTFMDIIWISADVYLIDQSYPCLIIIWHFMFGNVIDSIFPNIKVH